MPKSGYKAITVSEKIYEQIVKKMNEANEKADYKKFRSITHFVEESVMEFWKSNQAKQERSER